ncbi:MAG: D-tyrosyl-tRNA(Tyr) deacylase [Nitrospinae bacterium]|nr:D-tyrosyl-tRNA(Tyr) deacylase [Nitrospinota bacterium]
MIAVIQRVNRASVTVEDHLAGAIGHGLLILLGAARGDGEREARYLCDKVANLRIFSDSDGKMNHSLKDVGGSALVVSQFTLLGDWRNGRRPGYEMAAPPAEAKPLMEMFIEGLRDLGVKVDSGVFGAHMKVNLENDGPVTFVLDTAGITA